MEIRLLIVQNIKIKKNIIDLKYYSNCLSESAMAAV
jgi:hypothetical protein